MNRSVVLLLLFLPLAVAAKQPTVSGYVTDVQTGERLIGATVMDLYSGIGTVTNVNGFYSLTMSADSVQLMAGYVGYDRTLSSAFMLMADTLVEMELVSATVLKEVVVEGTHSVSGTHSVQMSAVEVPISQIKGIPAIGGEVDVLKAIQLLPGVQSGSEGSAGLYVRGGGPDENLILLDGVPLYSVNHMLGFFSVFNADAIKNVTLYEGNFPARYGGRLSSIIDVRQKDGDAYSHHGNLTVGLISTKVSVEGPIYWNKDDWRKYRNKETLRGQTTFNISARRTLYDLFIAPIAAIVSSKESDGEQVATAGYYFYDLNAKLTHTFSENDKLSSSFYMGDDVIYARLKQNESASDDSDVGFMRMRYNWGNLFAAANYEHRFNGRMYNTSQISYTRYKYKLGLTEEVDSKAAKEHIEVGMDYNSYIMDLMAQTNFEWRPNNRHEVHFGGSYTFHTFRPQVGRFEGKEITDSTTLHLDSTFSIGGTNYAHEANVYIEDTYTPCSWFKLNIGLHAGLFHTDKTTYPSIEPRVGLRFLPHKDVAIKLSYAYMSQYVHMLSNSSVSLPTDLWVPVTAKIPPMHSMQAALGITYNVLNQVELSVEGYYKRMINLLEYKDGATYMSSKNWQELVCVGDGWSYGVQFLAQRKIGPVTGWIGYTWSRTMRRFDREGQVINFGKPFHAKYDREHDLSVTLQYQINKKWDVAATFVYGTGTRGTVPLQKYDDSLINTLMGKGGAGTSRNIYFVSERNNYKMPDYHRLDLGATCHLPDKKHFGWEHILNISVYNAYCNFNPFLVYPRGNKLYKLSLFPILPSLSYTFKF